MNIRKPSKKSWKAMQYKCLKTFGPNFLDPVIAMTPDQIQAIKDKLFKLGDHDITFILSRSN